MFVGSVLQQYCGSEIWRPVYLDEVSIVFVRREPATEALIERAPINCSTAPLPEGVDSGNRAEEFNRWANAANLLLALQRNREAAVASSHALSIFSDSAMLWYVHGKSELLMGNAREAEQDFLQSATLKANVATWSELANLYRRQRRFLAATKALEQLTSISPDPSGILVALGYTTIDAGQPQNALQAFERAEKALPHGSGRLPLAEIKNGEALAWSRLRNLDRATFFEEQAVRIAPQNTTYCSQLARFYELQGRPDDARRVRGQAFVQPRQPIDGESSDPE